MPPDPKIEEILQIVREERVRNDHRFDEVLQIVRDERQLNNARFSQLTTGLMDVRKDMGDVKTGLAKLDAKIDHVYDSLSQDIQVFAEDLSLVKRRVSRLEKKVFEN